MLQFLKEHQEEVGVFDPEGLKILSAALDEAWKSIEASGATYETENERKAVREILAKRIVSIAKHGERNAHDLARDALTHLAITQGSRRRRS